MARKKSLELDQQRRRIIIGVVVLLALSAVAAAWKWTPLADLITLDRLGSWASAVRDGPVGLLYLLAGYILGSVLLVPITVLILLTAIIFGPILGSIYSLIGCLAGAAITYLLGYILGQDFVQKIAGAKWQRLEHKIGQAGIIAVATLRLLPVAPFTLVNIVSGAFKVPVRDYFVGSFLGLAPGILITNLFARQFERAIHDPGIGTFLLLALLIVITIGGSLWLRHRLNE